MDIGIFGGSFNPIHNGHIAVARCALEEARLDEVWFVVSPHNPFKQHAALMDDNLRLRMVRAALQNEQGLVCSDYEFRLPQPSYMCNTLRALAEDYPSDTFSLLIGADNWGAFPQWRDSSYILAHHRILIYPRRGCEIEPKELPAGVEYLPSPNLDISATDIRQRLAQGVDASSLIPQRALEILLAFTNEQQ